MAIIRIMDMKRRRRKKQRPLLENALEGARIKVLATGCSHCSAMRDNVREAVRELGLEAELECISDLERIAKTGVCATPSLVVDGRLVSSGRVMNVSDIKAAIIEIMAETDRAGADAYSDGARED